MVLAANKADNEMRKAQAVEFYELGLGTPLPVSAYHNEGVDDEPNQRIRQSRIVIKLQYVDVDVPSGVRQGFHLTNGDCQQQPSS